MTHDVDACVCPLSSPQKECPTCQDLRLKVKEAISKNYECTEIYKRKQAYAEHLQWMLKQRAALQTITHKSSHEKYLVENADKCGDHCLYLPSSQRVSGDNAGKYRYRLSLQANVYAGKLLHLSILLPNLITGENFGITSFLCGLASMVKLGQVTPKTRIFMRGVDGGSENVNHAALGMNAFLVHSRRFDVVQQHRLPPSHSHIYLTDGLFSVLEKWLTGDGFPGCNTLPDLMQYLRKKLAEAPHYSDKALDLHVLIANFSFTKWFDGHLNRDKVKRIGDPLVWRHSWCADTGTVVHQYKFSLADTATFERDEWGPWLEEEVMTNDPLSGEVVSKTVFRSDPLGVDLIRSYPNIADYPGMEDWLSLEDWKADQVFYQLSKWKFQNKHSQSIAAWKETQEWHLAHQLVEDFNVGEPLCLGDRQLLTTPMTWEEMWGVILGDVQGSCHSNSNIKDKISNGKSPMSSSSKPRPFLDPRSKDVDREGLSKSKNLTELNRVRHSRYTDKDQAKAIASDESYGDQYVRDNLNTLGALFLINLQHAEGEFAVGLGKRTFNTDVDDDDAGKYEIQWFERKSKRQNNWGQRPQFCIAVEEQATRNRKKTPMTSVELLSDFLKLAVKTTPKSMHTDNPVLTMETMQALRKRMSPATLNDDESSTSGSASPSSASVSQIDSSDEELQIVTKRKRKV